MIVLKQGRRHELHKRGESQLRNHPAAAGDFLQKNFPVRKAAMEDNLLARLRRRLDQMGRPQPMAAQ